MTDSRENRMHVKIPVSDTLMELFRGEHLEGEPIGSPLQGIMNFPCNSVNLRG